MAAAQFAIHHSITGPSLTLTTACSSGGDAVVTASMLLQSGMGLATGKAADATARQPEASGKIQSILVLGLALTESCAIYGFVSALIVIFTLA